MNSSLQYVGLFGYSEGAIIRNVVLDSSCYVVSSYSGSYYVGGITGRCDACTIENTVNMASVSFTGNTSWNLFLGGIAGYLCASNNDATVRNYANYGSVAHSGTVFGNARIGGIVRYSYGNSQNKVFIQNCLNYGTVTYSGASRDLYIGGILGSTSSGTNNIENCVSTGKITSNTANNYIGSVVGYASSSTTTNITHCYWTSDVGCDKAYGSGSPTIDSETKQVT